MDEPSDDATGTIPDEQSASSEVAAPESESPVDHYGGWALASDDGMGAPVFPKLLVAMMVALGALLGIVFTVVQLARG